MIDVKFSVGNSIDVHVEMGPAASVKPSDSASTSIAPAALTARTLTGTIVTASYKEVSD